MEISIRRTASAAYHEVKITDGQTTIDLGLLSDDECSELAETLQEAVDELTRHIEDSRY